MLKLRLAKDRGHFENNWLNSWHSFSFSSYFDPNYMDFSHLRVINDDRVAANQGFGMHAHQNMEIITFMLEGSIEHEDSLGNKHLLKTGNAQLMRAGNGIKHSEINIENVDCHLLQIWIKPNVQNLPPGWWEKSFTTSGNILIAEPTTATNKIHDLLEVTSSGLRLAQNGYILVIKDKTTLNFSEFGASDVYFHQINGRCIIDNNKIIEGDALSAKDIINNIHLVPDANSSTLVFIFPK